MRPSQSSTVRGDIDVRWDAAGGEANVVAIVENFDGCVVYWRASYASRFDPFRAAVASYKRDAVTLLESWAAYGARDEHRCVCGTAWTRDRHCITCDLHTRDGYRCDDPHCKRCC